MAASSAKMIRMYATIQGKKINYEIGGRGHQWIVFVHGWGGTHRSLKKLAEHVGGKYKTLIFDLPGFGQSDYPGATWGVEEYAGLVVALLAELQIEKPIYFGHSFGGSLGIYIAAHTLVSLEKLVLCATSYKRTGKMSKPAVLANRFMETYFPFVAGLLSRAKPLLYKIFFRNSDLAKYPHLESNFRKIVTQDLTLLLSEIDVPTLILWGERDTYTPVAYADELEAKIRGSQKVVFPFKSHNLPIRYPEEVWQEMKVFLK